MLPFGSANYEFIGKGVLKTENVGEIPNYIEPSSTGIEEFNISYEDHPKYLVPETTASA
jgi:hypothetical protein